MAEQKVRLVLNNNLPMNAWDFHVVLSDSEAVYAVGSTLDYKALKPGETTNPLLSIPNKSVQDLMDQLWAQGVRPHGYKEPTTETSGELAATKKHLEDMRSILFDTLELKK